MMRRGTWISIFFIGFFSLKGFAAQNYIGWVGHGQCVIEVKRILNTDRIPFSSLQEIYDNNMQIVDKVSSINEPQSTMIACMGVLKRKCDDLLIMINGAAFAAGLHLGAAELLGPMCYKQHNQNLQPKTQPDDVPEGGKIIDINRNLYQDLPPQLQPGWLLEHLPRSLSDVINLEGLVNWFDGFMGEVLRALHEMKRMGGYWLEYLSGVLLKILILSVVAALVLLVTPVSAVAALAQLAAVALLIVSILGTSGVEFDASKLTPSWQSSALLDVKFDVQNNLRQNDEGILAGNVSVSYALMNAEKADQYKLYFASNNGHIDFYIQKNDQKTIEHTWQMPGSNDNPFNFADR